MRTIARIRSRITEHRTIARAWSDLYAQLDQPSRLDALDRAHR